MLNQSISVGCAVVAAVAAAYISWRYGQDRKESWFRGLAIGFAASALDIIFFGRGRPVSVGMLMLAIGMITIAIEVDKELSKKQ